MGCAQSQPVSEEVIVDGRPHRDVRRAPTWRADVPITRQSWERMREEFWESRVEGRAEVWGQLRGIADLMIQNKVPEANVLLREHKITSPTGTLDNCFDALGNQYAVPAFCLSPPTNMLASESRKKRRPKSSIASQRLSLRLPDAEVNVALGDTGADLKRMFHDSLVAPNAAEAVPAERMRVFFMGREIADDDYLADCRLDEGMVVQVMVKPA